MKYIRNIILQSFSALVMCSSLCASPAEPTSADVQSFMEAHKQQLLKRVIATLDHEYDENAFKECYDEYRSYFPQADAQFTDALKSHLKLRIGEKLATMSDLQKELKHKKEQKSIVNNCAIFATAAGLTAAVLSYLADGNIESVYALGSKYALGASAVAWAITYMGKTMLEPDISYFNIQLKVGAKQLAQLNEAYAYVFPGELRLSDQIGELILIDRLKP